MVISRLVNGVESVQMCNIRKIISEQIPFHSESYIVKRERSKKAKERKWRSVRRLEHTQTHKQNAHGIQRINRAISNDYVQLHGYYGSIKCCIFGICLVVLFWVSFVFLSLILLLSSSSLALWKYIYIQIYVSVYGKEEFAIAVWYLWNGNKTTDIDQLPRVSGASASAIV